MSRVGQMPVVLPEGVTAQMEDHEISITGPKGSLSRTLHPRMQVKVEENQIIVKRPSNEREYRSLHGLTRALIANMVQGVTQGYEKAMDVYGVGFRVGKEGDKLVLQLGFSHPIEIVPPQGIEFNVETSTATGENDYLTARITVSGMDKELVGETAARIRACRKPEPYKGKGIRYVDEYVRRKPGKAAQAGKLGMGPE